MKYATWAAALVAVACSDPYPSDGAVTGPAAPAPSQLQVDPVCTDSCGGELAGTNWKLVGFCSLLDNLGCRNSVSGTQGVAGEGLLTFRTDDTAEVELTLKYLLAARVDRVCQADSLGSCSQLENIASARTPDRSYERFYSNGQCAERSNGCDCSYTVNESYSFERVGYGTNNSRLVLELAPGEVISVGYCVKENVLTLRLRETEVGLVLRREPAE